MKIGLIREKKNPPDRRVAFLPEQCSAIQDLNSGITFRIEPSPVRCVTDEQYMAQGLSVDKELRNCDYLFGIKEVPIDALIPNKTYFFFSHTIKKQAHNQKLLQAVLEKNITLVDYECLQDSKGNRTVAFGRFAGIVGAYNAFRMWMLRYNQIHLKAASECGDMEEMLDYARHHTSGIGPIKIIITGTGRVGHGAVEVLKDLGIKEVEPSDFIDFKSEGPVFTCLSSRHYLKHKNGKMWDENHFRKNPGEYTPDFMRFAQCTDLLIPCHYWNPEAPVLFTPEDCASPDFKIKIISDVTCDLNGSIPSTTRASTIEDPFYDLDPVTWEEKEAFSGEDNLTICAVDNLPCELPFDASKAFGDMLQQHVIPEIISGNHVAIDRASIVIKGKLSAHFEYLRDYAFGHEEIVKD